ncbi:MAG TPA: YbaK/EbsC family protein [Candidatus Limnocylindria bacterium]|nr:YbaK/EbsC family protein [Candidatus Limnocylindria bacterium]
MRAHAAGHGVAIEPRRFAATTRTAQDAAREIGCDVAEIVKSLVFLADDQPVVVLCAGADRVDESRLKAALGAGVVRRATADEAKSATGYPIGGVPPFAHAGECRVVADARLLGHAQVWAAAGLPDAVFPIAPRDLIALAGARVADVVEVAGAGR